MKKHKNTDTNTETAVIIPTIERHYKQTIMPYDFNIFIGSALVLLLLGKWVIAVLLVIAWIALRLYLTRDILLMGIRSTEIQVFGKPLEKGFWKRKEKVKTRWQK